MNTQLREEKNQTKNCRSNFLVSDIITHFSILTRRTSIKLAGNETTGTGFISQFQSVTNSKKNPSNTITQHVTFVFLWFKKVG